MSRSVSDSDIQTMERVPPPKGQPQLHTMSYHPRRQVNSFVHGSDNRHRVYRDAFMTTLTSKREPHS